MSAVADRRAAHRYPSEQDHSAHPPDERCAPTPPKVDASETNLMTPQPADTDNDKLLGLKPDKNRDRFVRLSVNLSIETAEIFKSLIERKGLSITEGIRRAIAVWKFLEDEKSRGNEIAVIEPDNSVRKVILL
jgi:hypothetical protein